MAASSSFLGRGWAFPPSFGAGGASVDMVADVQDIQQSLRILLGTIPGERVMVESFGCDLSRFLFEEIDQRLLNKLKRLVSDAVLEFEPRIKLESVDISRDDAVYGLLSIRLSYLVRGTNSRFNMVFPYYLMEATQPGP
ncbi:MAG TPA: GPW/gp25 family protein [Pseudomonadota bacterium]|nr:GPW/gp25 family protein [Pseudomonadota bacterium]